MSHEADTPRTDAEIWDVVYHHKNEIVVDAVLARELERELNELWSRFDKQMEAEAEVERLKENLEIAEENLASLR
jgi:predicted outer membrane protein